MVTNNMILTHACKSPKVGRCQRSYRSISGSQHTWAAIISAITLNIQRIKCRSRTRQLQRCIAFNAVFQLHDKNRWNFVKLVQLYSVFLGRLVCSQSIRCIILAAILNEARLFTLEPLWSSIFVKCVSWRIFRLYRRHSATNAMFAARYSLRRQLWLCFYYSLLLCFTFLQASSAGYSMHILSQYCTLPLSSKLLSIIITTVERM